MLQKMRVTCYDDAFEKFTFPDMGVNVNIVIPCYAFPNMFPGHAQLDKLPPSAWNFAAGFHPRSAEYEYPGYMAQFRSLARMERAVAIGEVGIDYTRGVSEHTIRKQHPTSDTNKVNLPAYLRGNHFDTSVRYGRKQQLKI